MAGKWVAGGAVLLCVVAGLAGSAGAQPVAKVTPGFIDFGLSASNGMRSLPITVENAGNVELSLDTVNLMDPAGAFRLEGTPAMPATLAPGDKVTLQVSVVPGDQLGQLSAEVDLDTSDPTARHIHIPLDASSVVAPLPSPSSLTFPAALVGSVSAAKSFELVNTLAQSLFVSGLSLAGTNPNQFSLDDSSAPFTIAPGKKRVVQVSYLPVSGGTHDASVVIAFPTLPPALVKLSGTAGLHNDQVKSSPTELPDFGEVFVGLRSPPAPVMLTVPVASTIPITITAITSTSSEFLVDTSATQLTLAPGDSTSFNVVFAPTAGGPRSGAVNLSVRGLNTPIATYAVHGTGIKPTVTPALPPSTGCSLGRAPPPLTPALLLLALPLLALARRPRSRS